MPSIRHTPDGGTIWAERRSTGGARVALTLPLANPNSEVRVV
jgi:hypothetical protein